MRAAPSSHVLVSEIVAVDHRAAQAPGESDKDFHRAIREDVQRVFFIRVLLSALGRGHVTAVDAEHLEISEVAVHRVIDVGRERPVRDHVGEDPRKLTLQIARPAVDSYE